MRAPRHLLRLGLALGLAATIASCRPEAPKDREAAIDLLAAAPGEVMLETRRYRFGVDDRSALLSGWSSRNERDRQRRPFVWATAEESRFRLDVVRVEDKQAIVRLRAFPSAEPQRIEVRVNDRVLALLRPEIDDREFRLEIPAEALREGANVLAFRHAFVTSGPNPRDPRRFAAAYSALLVGPACLPLRALGEPEPPFVKRREDRRRTTVTGPAAIVWAVDVPPGARLVAKVATSPRTAGPAEVLVQAKTADGEWATLAAETLRRSWFRRASVTRVSADLAPLAGTHADLRLVVRPLACTTSLATVKLKRLAITLQNADGP